MEAQGMDLETLNPEAAKKDVTASKIQELKDKRMEQKDGDDYVLTQEPLSVEGYLKARLNDMDTGAGVFGALAHMELPQYGGKKKSKALNDFFTAVDFDDEEEVGPPKYMVKRESHMCELEEVQYSIGEHNRTECHWYILNV